MCCAFRMKPALPWPPIPATPGASSSLPPALWQKPPPLRYRGYYYDAETALYYLQSRYYDPTACRFLNADGYASTGQGIVGTNMFAYCNNDPILFVDFSGSRAVVRHDGSGFSAMAMASARTYSSAKEAAISFAESTYAATAYIRHARAFRANIRHGPIWR